MKHLLVVDDVAEIRRLVRLCALPRCRVSEAATAEVALEVARADPPDLVILDIGLGEGMDGLDMLTHLHRDPRLLTLPVILLSGRDPVDASRYTTAVAYIRKPFRPTELAECIRQVLG